MGGLIINLASVSRRDCAMEKLDIKKKNKPRATNGVDFFSMAVGFTIVIKWLKPYGAGIDTIQVKFFLILIIFFVIVYSISIQWPTQSTHAQVSVSTTVRISAG